MPKSDKRINLDKIDYLYLQNKFSKDSQSIVYLDKMEEKLPFNQYFIYFKHSDINFILVLSNIR